MRRNRVMAAVVLFLGTAAALLFGSGVASAVSVSPVGSDGVQVDLSHDETVALSNSNAPRIIAALPINLHDAATGAPYGADLEMMAGHSAKFPQGHLTLGFFGPLNNISYGMIAYTK